VETKKVKRKRTISPERLARIKRMLPTLEAVERLKNITNGKLKKKQTKEKQTV
jgi:hypothetical protein